MKRVFTAMAALVFWATSAAGEGQTVIRPAGVYVQAPTGMSYPESLDDFQRANIIRYKEDGTDESASYNRVVLLKEIEQSDFFQKVRGDLIVSLYNQKEVWPRFGYEGSSAEHGGYINRGFADIDWLPKA